MEDSKLLEINKEKWDKWAATYDDKGFKNNFLRQAQESVISILNLNENISLLDIGCGTGWALGQAAKLTGGKGTFYGVDLSDKMLDKAKENFKEFDNFHFIQANANSIPLEDNLFDLIICTNSFHHHLHPELTLKEMFRLLKAGGRTYILDPTADSWFIKMMHPIFVYFDPAHVKIYSTKEFKEMLIAAGFKYVGREKVKGQKIHIGEK